MGRLRQVVIETLQAMATWLPERIMNFLELLPGQEYEPAGWEMAETPTDLATIVLNDMENRMFVKFPWYGTSLGRPNYPMSPAVFRLILVPFVY